MNVIIEDESKKEKRLRILYISIIAICIISIIAALIIQITKENTQPIARLPQLTDDKISVYKQQFNEIFENKVNYLENNSYKISKIKENEEIVYLGYQNNQ